MRPVAVQARGRRVHGHCWDCPLCLPMTAPALSRLEGCERSRIVQLAAGVGRAVIGEGVATHAVGVRARTEASLRQARRVFDGGLRSVTGRAALGRDRAHARTAQLVAAIARDPLPFDVHGVPGYVPVRAPGSPHVDPTTKRDPAAALRVRIGTAQECQEHQRAQPQAGAEPNRVSNGSLCTGHGWNASAPWLAHSMPDVLVLSAQRHDIRSQLVSGHGKACIAAGSVR